MMYLQGYLAPAAEGDEDGFPLEQVFCTRKCLGFVCNHAELDTDGTPRRSCRCWRRPWSTRRRRSFTSGSTRLEMKAPRRRCAASPGVSGRDGMNFPPKPWEVGWSSVPERRTLKVLKVQDSDQTYSTRSPSIWAVRIFSACGNGWNHRLPRPARRCSTENISLARFFLVLICFCTTLHVSRLPSSFMCPWWPVSGMVWIRT